MGPGHSLCVHEWGLNLGVQVRIHCDWGTGRDNPIGAQRARSCSERQLKGEFPQWVRRGEERTLEPHLEKKGEEFKRTVKGKESRRTERLGQVVGAEAGPVLSVVKATADQSIPLKMVPITESN